MSYEGVVPGKLKLKGKALPDGIRKKRRRRQHDYVPTEVAEADEEQEQERDQEGGNNDGQEHQLQQQKQQQRLIREEDEERQAPEMEDHRTAAEKRYEEQKINLEMKRLAKTANKSHRQRVEEFNQYLANLSEHYDIPKVGPG